MRGLLIGFVGALALYGLCDLGLRGWARLRDRLELRRRRRSLRLAKRRDANPEPRFPSTWFLPTVLGLYIVGVATIGLAFGPERPAAPPRMGEEIRIQQPLPRWSDPVHLDATYYHPKYAGRTTANGEVYDPELPTAAHRTLPFGTYVEVVGPAGRDEVRINDRGPWCLHGPSCTLPCKRADIDLSESAMRKVGLLQAGRGWVRARRRL